LGVSRQREVVCIVGAGPAGLVVAHLLQRAEVSCIVLERLPADRLRARTKAGMIEQQTIDLLAPHGLAGTILARGARNGVCEFRADGAAFVLDYGALIDSPGHFIYPQHELVAEWAEQLLAAGGQIRFGTCVTGVVQDADGAVVTAALEATGEPLELVCDAVVVCDGAGSELAAGMAGVEAFEVGYPFRWLTVIAAVSPPTPRTIYSLHARGFAGQMRRSSTLTRYMLEVPLADGVGDWPDDRIWAELQRRLAVAGRPALQEGELVERDMLDLRVRVREPMQFGRVFLAGDAAHLVTPAGGKGMNLAIQDAIELAAGLCECYGPGRAGERLVRYSDTRLPAVWRYQEFSNLMLSLFAPGVRGSEDGNFAFRLSRARLERVLSDPQFSRWFAHAYIGTGL
jgi:p-hydroxybenzoate 3-monooxygenase